MAKTKSKKSYYDPAGSITLPPIHPALIPAFGYCYAKSALRLRKRYAEELEKLGVQLPQMGLMIILSKVSTMNQISLGEQVAIDKATMVKILDDMEESDFVRRKTDPNDRRVKLVELTAKGRTILPKMQKVREGIEAQFLSVLTKAEATELKRLVTKLATAERET